LKTLANLDELHVHCTYCAGYIKAEELDDERRVADERYR
jgi:hypothetical protein